VEKNFSKYLTPRRFIEYCLDVECFSETTVSTEIRQIPEGITMRNITTILLVTAAFAALAVSGCDVGGSRKHGAATRWEQTMEQVRLDAARESLAQGRYEYARKVLEPCMNSPRKHQDAEQLMVKIEAAHQVYAQLSSYRDDDNKDRAY
jgi:hypothetical protein